MNVAKALLAEALSEAFEEFEGQKATAHTLASMASCAIGVVRRQARRERWVDYDVYDDRAFDDLGLTLAMLPPGLQDVMPFTRDGRPRAAGGTVGATWDFTRTPLHGRVQL